MSMWRVGREAVRITDPVLTPLDASIVQARAAAARSADAGAADAGAGTAGVGAPARRGSSGRGAGGPLGDIADTVAKWIPGEVLALYVAGVTMIGSPNWFWLVVGVLLAPTVVVLAAFANSGQFPPSFSTRIRAVTGFVAMLVWSLTVPGSGWHSWSLVRDNAAAVAVAAGAVGLLFGLAAEGVSRWADNQPVIVRRPRAARRVPSVAPPAGSPPAGSPPAGSPPAGSPPAGPPPAGPPQAGPPQAGPPQAGPPQAGPLPAGSPSAGPPSAGPPSAGPPGGVPRWAAAGSGGEQTEAGGSGGRTGPAPQADDDTPTTRIPTTRRSVEPQPMRMPSIPPD